MAHWNGGVGEFGVFLVLGICGEVYGMKEVKREESPHTHRPISTLGQQTLIHGKT